MRASGLNAAWRHRRGGLPASTVWPRAFAAEAATLDALAVEAEPNSPSGRWARLVAAADAATDPRTLAERWLLPSDQMAAVGEDTLTAASSAIEAIDLATREAFPQLEPQLRLRIGPIRDQWDGYGPGLIAHVRRLTGLKAASPLVDVVAALPVGDMGMAVACPASRTVVIEGVLTNPMPRLPEVVRLAWCVAAVLWREQMNRPDAAGAFGPEATSAEEGGRRGPRRTTFRPITLEPNFGTDVLAVALLPAILAAAEIVELSRCEEATLQVAMRSYLEPLAVEPPPVAKLLHWWETFLQTRPPWQIAVEALRRSLT